MGPSGGALDRLNFRCRAVELRLEASLTEVFDRPEARAMLSSRSPL